jgi:hypothetical protein
VAKQTGLAAEDGYYYKWPGSPVERCDMRLVGGRGSEDGWVGGGGGGVGGGGGGGGGGVGVGV